MDVSIASLTGKRGWRGWQTGVFLEYKHRLARVSQFGEIVSKILNINNNNDYNKDLYSLTSCH